MRLSLTIDEDITHGQVVNFADDIRNVQAAGWGAQGSTLVYSRELHYTFLKLDTEISMAGLEIASIRTTHTAIGGEDLGNGLRINRYIVTTYNIEDTPINNCQSIYDTLVAYEAYVKAGNIVEIPNVPKPKGKRTRTRIIKLGEVL